MSVVVINPLDDDRWDEWLNDFAFSQNCFFQGAGWAKVLQQTYGHRPFYFCRFTGNRMTELFPVMEIQSRLTGRKGITLPFADFCTALPEKVSKELTDAAFELGKKRNWRYLECRSASLSGQGSRPSVQFQGHSIDLRPEPSRLFQNCQPSFRRGVRKAETARLKATFETSIEGTRRFFDLHCGTRKRHGLPPQPIRFFENITHHILASGQGMVATAWLGKKALAASIFFYRGPFAIYKYGASDFAFQHLRPSNFLMWESIKHLAASGLQQLHLGRTSLANEGLRRFKLSLGASEQPITYSKYDFNQQMFVSDMDRSESWANRVFRQMPQPLLRMAGRILYPHLS